MSGATRRNPDANFRALKLMVEAEAARKTFYGRRPGAAYQTPEELILRHGRRWRWQPLSRDLSPATRWGLERGCFSNSMLAAQLHLDLRYVEGFAYAGATPVHHAWNVDPRGVVLDFTWREYEFLPRMGRAYLGVVVPLDRVMHATWDLEASVLEDPPAYRSLMEPWVVNNHPARPSDEAIIEFMRAVGGDEQSAIFAKLQTRVQT